MKRYMVSIARDVHTDISKKGYMFSYVGRVDDWESAVVEWEERYNKWRDNPSNLGIRIKDSVTKQVIFEKLWDKK